MTIHEHDHDAHGHNHHLIETLLSIRGLYVVRIAPEGICTFSNDSFSQLFLKKHYESGAHFSLLYDEADQDSAFQAMSECLHAPEKAVIFTARMQDSQGILHWVRWEYVAQCNENKIPQEIHAIGIDITEEKRFENVSLELIDRFDRITKHLPGSIYVYVLRPDGSSYFSYSSVGMTSLLGVSRERLAENAEILLRLIRNDYVRDVMESVYYSAEHLTDWHAIFPVIVHDKTIWIEGKSSPQKSVTGNIVWYGYFNDITEAKHKEDALREHTHLLEKLAELNPVTISLYDVVQKKHCIIASLY